MDRIVLVIKPTRLQELVREHLTEGAAQFLLESRVQSFEPYRREDAAYKAAFALIRSQIPSDLPVATVTRADLPNFLFRETDLIVVCGPDGLFANLAKYVSDQPILTINPDPANIAGVLMLFSPSETGKMISLVREGGHRVERLPLVKACVDDDRVLWGVNDIFIGRRDHVSARYSIAFEKKTERQSSSGIIVSTGVGSTGWIRSIATMVAALDFEAGTGNRLSFLPRPTDTKLIFVVREPFPSPDTGVSLVTGWVTPDKPLIVHSEMPEGGCIFSDGVVEKAIEWNAGSTVTISVGSRFVNRIVQ